jgi:hypothetical protein
MESPTTTTRPPRPAGVALIALFLLVDAAVGFAEVVLGMSPVVRSDSVAAATGWMPGLLVVITLLEAWAAVGLWRGSRRAWVMAMLLVGVGLVAGLVLRWAGDPSYIRLAIYVVMALYLNQGAVREYVTWRPGASTAAAGGPRT